MGERHTRRQFVRRGSAAALVAASAPALLLTSSPPASAATTAAELRRRPRGTLLTPHDPGWSTARALFNPRLDVAPRAIAFCATTADVGEVVRFSRSRGRPVAGRGGRHSFAGYSNVAGGIVADVSRIDAVELEADRPVVRVGGGASVLDVFRDLVLAHDRVLPVGTCPTVGVAGLTLGGGFGHLMRGDGVTADSLRAATVVLADGRTVRCWEDAHPDLFWALRGDGAGYAIVTQRPFATRAGAAPIAFTLSYPWTQAAAAIDAGSGRSRAASSTLSYGRLRALRSRDGALTLTASGHWYGGERALRELLAPLGAAGPARTTPRKRTVAEAALPDSVVLHADGPVVVDPAAFPNYQRSAFFGAPLLPEAIAALVAQIERWPGVGGAGHEGGVQLDALGAAVNRPRPNATAFVHRRQRMHCAHLSFWGRSDPAAMAQACAQWTRDTEAALRPYASGSAVQNDIDPDLTAWPDADYGTNLRRLQAVKRRYDPAGRFDFAQGV